MARTKHYTAQDVIDVAEVVADATDRNDHTGALLNIANFFLYTKFIKIFEAIDVCHDQDDSMSQWLIKYRSEKSDEMMMYIKKTEGEEVYDVLHNAL